MSKICRQLLGVDPLIADDVELFGQDLIFHARPRWRKPRCGGCGQLASKAVDEVRRDEVRALRDSAAARFIKGSRYALLKSPWNMTREQKQQLSEIQHNNRRLYRARLLNDALADTLEYRQPKRARQALDEWLAWASRSQLQPFIKLARAICKHKERILAYIEERYTNAIVEGMNNNRIRMIARRAYGFHSADALKSMIFLCLGGIKPNPPLPTHQKSRRGTIFFL